MLHKIGLKSSLIFGKNNLLRPYFLFTFFFGLFFTAAFSQNSFYDSAVAFDKSADFFRSETYFEKALNNDNLSDSTTVEALILLARAKRINQKYSEGIELLNEAKLLSDSIASEYLSLKTVIQIGDYYRAIDALELSLEYLSKQKPEDFGKYPNLKNQYYHRLAATNSELVNKNQSKSTLSKVLALSKEALKIARKNNFEEAMATSFNEMAYAYERDEKYEQAIAYYDSANIIFKARNLIDFVNSAKNKQRVLYKLGNYDSCISLGKELIKLSEGKNWSSIEYHIYHHIANSYLAKGDSVTGLKYEVQNHLKYIETIKAIFKKDLTELQVEFDLSNKEREIESKEREIQQSKTFQFRLLTLLTFLILLVGLIVMLYLQGRRKNVKLEKLLKENAFLIGEANHRIKNNLQLIVSLLSEEIRKSTSNNSQLLNIKAKIESISTLHQLLYLNEDKSTIPIEKYLNEIVENFSGVLEEKGVTVNSSCRVEGFPIEKSLHLGLLLTELIINSLKHAFNDNKNIQSQIEFSLVREGSSIIFTYKDNGGGLKNGSNPKLISILADQLEATDITKEGKGYNFSIEIPK